MARIYQPNDQIISRYADVMVNFALNQGRGIQKDEVARIVVPDWAKQMLPALQEAILRAGGHCLPLFLPTGVDARFYQAASPEQLAFFPEAFHRGYAQVVNHLIQVSPLYGPKELESVPPEKILARRRANQPLANWLLEKENAGLYSWSICFFGTKEYADEAGMSLKKYWNQIIKACYLNDPNPVQRWRETGAEIDRIRQRLNMMNIDRVHVQGQNVDLWVQIGRMRQWKTGVGRNVPSFEIFTSPDWRGTTGWVRFNRPLYYNGVKIEGIHLVFKNGLVVEAHAETNEDTLLKMLAEPNANRLGEFSLTDARHSEIDEFMANTLFDENAGGQFGNFHIAAGRPYPDTFTGDLTTVTDQIWAALGYNSMQCTVHADFVSTEDRVVTAYLRDQTEMVIYRNGQFQV